MHILIGVALLVLGALFVNNSSKITEELDKRNKDDSKDDGIDEIEDEALKAMKRKAKRSKVFGNIIIFVSVLIIFTSLVNLFQRMF